MPMLITLLAVGRLKAGPERELYDRYAERITQAGRSMGLGYALKELPESRASGTTARKNQEAEALLSAVPPGSVIVALDETGKTMDSRSFATRLGAWRDASTASLVLAIGGADGHGHALLEKAALRLAFGAMTWPHQLVRIMAAEQLYRSVTIISGHPYHRD